MPPPTPPQRSEEKYRALLETIDQGFCVVEVLFDDQGRAADYCFLETNPAFERHTGLVDAVGKRMRELHPTHEEHWFRIYGEVALTGVPVHFENPAHALGRWYEVYAFRIGAEEERQVGILFKDITQRKRDDELLREGDRRKDEFIAILAHELKNPLAPLRSSVDLLLHPAAELDIAHSMAPAMDRQLSHLERLVEDLMHVARISSGKLDLRRARVDLNQVLRDALELSRERIDGGGHAVRLDLVSEPVVVTGDAVRLVQTVANLLNNAAKYSDAGTPIRVSLSTEDNQALIHVVDEGIGIPAETLPRVFDMFMQGRNGKGQRDGLGIGLTLVRRLVEAHGGSVQARSAGAGKGSDFLVRLPLAEAQAQAKPAPARARPAAGAQVKRVLVVDDNRDAADTLRKLLEREGHEVRTAYDGAQALSAAAEFHPHVVLLDLGLPDMSGQEVAQRMASDPGLGDVTFAALTGWGQAEDRVATSEAGFTHHLVKPAGLEDLRRVLK